jgi:hypothetical protein
MRENELTEEQEDELLRLSKEQEKETIENLKLDLEQYNIDMIFYLKVIYMNLAVPNPNIDKLLEEIKAKIDKLKGGQNGSSSNNRTN